MHKKSKIGLRAGLIGVAAITMFGGLAPNASAASGHYNIGHTNGAAWVMGYHDWNDASGTSALVWDTAGGTAHWSSASITGFATSSWGFVTGKAGSTCATKVGYWNGVQQPSSSC